MTIIFVSIAAIAVIWYIVTGLVICNWLGQRSYKVNYVFLRLFLPLYVNQYKKITAAETGKAGALYYHWIISINIALASAAAAVVSGLV
jgi:hypothetical protein